MPTTPTFDSISLAELSFVTGGCKKKCAPPPPPPPAPAPAAPPPSPAPSAPEIITNVTMTGFGSSGQTSATG